MLRKLPATRLRFHVGSEFQRDLSSFVSVLFQKHSCYLHEPWCYLVSSWKLPSSTNTLHDSIRPPSHVIPAPSIPLAKRRLNYKGCLLHDELGGSVWVSSKSLVIHICKCTEPAFDGGKWGPALEGAPRFRPKVVLMRLSSYILR
jgi:hypothetical protein